MVGTDSACSPSLLDDYNTHHHGSVWRFPSRGLGEGGWPFNFSFAPTNVPNTLPTSLPTTLSSSLGYGFNGTEGTEGTGNSTPARGWEEGGACGKRPKLSGFMDGVNQPGTTANLCPRLPPMCVRREVVLCCVVWYCAYVASRKAGCGSVG